MAIHLGTFGAELQPTFQKPLHRDRIDQMFPGANLLLQRFRGVVTGHQQFRLQYHRATVQLFGLPRQQQLLAGRSLSLWPFRSVKLDKEIVADLAAQAVEIGESRRV